MSMNKGRILPWIVLLSLLGLRAAAAGEGVSPLDVMNAESDIAEQVQRKVLDPILGEGRSCVFAQVTLEFSKAQLEQRKLGKGQTTKEMQKTAAAGPESAASQYSEQVKAEDSSALTLSLKVLELRLRIVQDEQLPQAALDAAKKVLLAVFKGALKPEDLEWVPAPFGKSAPRLPSPIQIEDGQ